VGAEGFHRASPDATLYAINTQICGVRNLQMHFKFARAE